MTNNNIMKLLSILIVFILCTLTPSFGDDNVIKQEVPSPSESDTGHGDVSTPKAQSIGDAIRDLMDDLSHMTSLHDSFVHHPLISRLHMDKPFSSLEPFGAIKRWSPRYEVINDADTFHVKLDVPGFHFHELNVELEAGGRLLSISGTKEDGVHKTAKHHDHAAMGEKDKEDDDDGTKFEFISHTTTSFEQKFTLDTSIDTTKMTANLVNGVLEVRAPRKISPRIKRHIPITQFDQDVWTELISNNEAPDQATTVLKTE